MSLLDRLLSRSNPDTDAMLVDEPAHAPEVERELDAARARIAQLEAELADSHEKVAEAERSLEQISNLTESLAESRARSAKNLQDVKNARARVEEMNSTLAQHDNALKVALAEAKVATEEKDHLIRAVRAAIEELTVSMSASAKECCEGAVAAESVGMAAHSAMNEAAEAASRAAEIIDVSAAIQKVADRTRLLSLNAKIEASKANEFGRGFGVVADEVGRLSQEASDASDRVARVASVLESSTRQVCEFIEELRESTQAVNQFSERVVFTTRKQEDAMLALGEQITTAPDDSEAAPADS